MARIYPGAGFSLTDKGPHVPFLTTCPVALRLGRLRAAVGIVRHRPIGPTRIRLFESETR